MTLFLQIVIGAAALIAVPMILMIAIGIAVSIVLWVADKIWRQL